MGISGKRFNFIKGELHHVSNVIQVVEEIGLAQWLRLPHDSKLVILSEHRLKLYAKLGH